MASVCTLLILVWLTLPTLVIISKMLNSIFDNSISGTDATALTETRGEMISIIQGDVDIMLGLQTVIRNMIEDIQAESIVRGGFVKSDCI